MAKFEEVYHELTTMGPVLTADKDVVVYAAETVPNINLKINNMRCAGDRMSLLDL